MNLRMLFILSSVITAAAGGLFLILPETGLAYFGTEIYVATTFVARLFGGAMIMAGLLAWFLKEFGGIQRTLGMLMLGGSVGGFIMTIIGMTAIGVIRSNAWVLLVVFGVFSLAYAFLLFGQQMAAPAGYQKQV